MTSGDINHGVSSLEVGPRRQGKGVQLLALTGFLGERLGRLSFKDKPYSSISGPDIKFKAEQHQLTFCSRVIKGNCMISYVL
jgi:hypothetical protein